MDLRAVGEGGWRRLAAEIAATVAFVGVATSLALVPDHVSTTSAALVYVLAVTAVSALAGLRAGLASAVLSFLALNYFFTAPVHTFTVAEPQDLVALASFLIVSVVVGTLLSTAVAQRARAERREREALLLQQFGARLLSGDPPELVLETFADSVVDAFRLARCDIVRSGSIDDPIIAEGQGVTAADEPPTVIPMTAMRGQVGEIRVFRAANRPRLTDEERGVLETFASQMGLALEGMRLREEATSARLEAETNRLRAALFSSVTHDLRTPLASITASVTSLLDAEASFTPEDRLDLLETIRAEAERLSRLVGNLLDLSRIRAGAVVPARRTAAIGEVIEGVVARLHSVLAGHEVRLMLRDSIPAASIDVIQIDQVLTNLLENAVKFSPTGTAITIAATRWQDVAEVRVADRGSGIRPEEREHVFEPFVRGDGAHAPGSGLGLSISQAIIESHGGRIWIEGTPGGGTTAVFQVPLERSMGARSGSSPGSGRGSSPS